MRKKEQRIKHIQAKDQRARNRADTDREQKSICSDTDKEPNQLSSFEVLEVCVPRSC